MEPVSIGLVGYGNRGKAVANAIDASPDLDLVSVCDQITERREAARKTLGVETDADLGDLLDRESVEAVAVMAGAAGHAPLSIAALEAGKHVLCAKPLADTVEVAAEMVETARREGLVGGVGFQKRFFEDVYTLREAAAARDPLQVLLTNQRGIYYSRFFRPGYSWGIMDGTSHWIDVANWIVDAPPVSVSATARYGQFTGAETIDAVTIQVEYTEGRTASIVASMGGPGMDPRREVVGRGGNVQVVGDEVEVRDVSWDDAHEEKERQRVSEKTLEASSPGEGDATQTVVEQFAARVRGEGGEHLATFRDGFDELRIAKAAVRSQERGERVHVSDVAPEV
jgi:predicted dehydrogenase